MLSIAPSTAFRIAGHKFCIITAEMNSEMRRGCSKKAVLLASWQQWCLESHCIHLCSQCRQSAGSLVRQTSVSALQNCFQAIGALFSDVRHQSIPSELVTNTRNISPSTLPSLLHLPLPVFKPIWEPASPLHPHHQFALSASLQGHLNMISFLTSPK